MVIQFKGLINLNLYYYEKIIFTLSACWSAWY